jgi:hypothetical protein
MTTEAQDEFDRLVANNAHRETLHPEDRDDVDSQHGSDVSEEEQYHNARIEEAMRMPTATAELRLPPVSFDNGRSTGVKGVIADARSYESARKTNWRRRAQSVRKSVFGTPRASSNKSESESEEAIFSGGDDDEEEFLSMWREARRQELEKESGQSIRTRRTSPSTRIYGRMDEVDALGYLDAIEKVNRETTVAVFVYDHEVRAPSTKNLSFTWLYPNTTSPERGLRSNRISAATLGQGESVCSFRQGPLRRH